MRICIASDSHDHWDTLARAVMIAEKRGCEHFLFAGDFVTPSGLHVFGSFSGHVHFVWGNNEGERVGMVRAIDAAPNMTLHGDVMETAFEGLRFYMNHYPGFVQNAALTGKYDVCIYGHNHLYHEETLPNGTTLLNPGEIAGSRTGNPTCMIFDTETRAVERVNLLRSR